MKSAKFFLTLFSLLLFYSCSKIELNKETESKNFPDIPAFFKAEAQRLGNNKELIVVKSTVLNDKKENKSLKIKDWNAELSMFLRYKIHEPAQRAYYKVTENGNIVQYETSVAAIQLKKLTVEYSDRTADKIKKMELEVVQSNDVYGSQMTMIYDVSKGYGIRKKQKVILFAEDVFEIELMFQ